MGPHKAYAGRSHSVGIKNLFTVPIINYPPLRTGLSTHRGGGQVQRVEKRQRARAGPESSKLFLSPRDGRCEARRAQRQSRRAGVVMSNGVRTLTVSRLYREWGEPHRKCECVVPSVRLNGKWLAALGIVPGQKIRVITNGPIITLAPVNFESELRRYGEQAQ